MSSVQIPISLLLIIVFLLATLFVALIFLFYSYLQNRRKIKERAQQLNLEWQQRMLDGIKRDLATQASRTALKQLEEWRINEIENVKKQQYETAYNTIKNVEFPQWKQEYERSIRQDAISKSRSTLVGKITEHFIPFLPDFSYNPKDARFLGSPVDYVVFDGLSEEELKRIVFVEVKTNLGTLTKRERQIRDAIQAGKVEWIQLKQSVEIDSDEPIDQI